LDKSNEYVITIKPGYTEFNYLNDLWRFRDLFYFLAWRDILVRYKQKLMTFAGYFWTYKIKKFKNPTKYLFIDHLL